MVPEKVTQSTYDENIHLECVCRWSFFYALNGHNNMNKCFHKFRWWVSILKRFIIILHTCRNFPILNRMPPTPTFFMFVQTSIFEKIKTQIKTSLEIHSKVQRQMSIEWMMMKVSQPVSMVEIRSSQSYNWNIPTTTTTKPEMVVQT